ncbi:MAG: radical SAM family heme chaperone HemW [Flavisolibacter sp.]
MAGIYLHIPFCKQACTYCNFHFSTSLQYKDELVNAIIKEAGTEKNYLSNEQVQTIYFGGGTPSLLTNSDCEKIMNAIYREFPVSTDVECTIEANPDDIHAEKLTGWRNAGINRLSIGVQSFQDEELRWMNRAHNAEQSVQCIHLSHQYGFNNLSVDLIYGSPLLTDLQWKENVEKAVSFHIPHLSCYALTVEEKTPLYKNIQNRSVMDINTDRQANQFLMLMQLMRENGYEHYEVSNFAKPGFRSRHNSSYWKGEKYLGLGPSAHSYNGIERRWNVSNNQVYIKSVFNNEIQREAETLTPDQALNEYIMISLRTTEGLDLSRLEQKWGADKRKSTESVLKNYVSRGLIMSNREKVQLTDEGMLMADGIASALFS